MLTRAVDPVGCPRSTCWDAESRRRRLSATYAAAGLHPLRLVPRVQVLVRVVAEVEHAALAAEPVRLAVVPERERRRLRVDLHAAHGILLDGHPLRLHALVVAFEAIADRADVRSRDGYRLRRR